MKEKIEQKLKENIERLLAKDELLPTDVAILKEKLNELKEEENKEKLLSKQKEMMETFLNNSFIGE